MSSNIKIRANIIEKVHYLLTGKPSSIHNKNKLAYVLEGEAKHDELELRTGYQNINKALELLFEKGYQLMWRVSTNNKGLGVGQLFTQMVLSIFTTSSLETSG